jgi:hypothetical protein
MSKGHARGNREFKKPKQPKKPPLPSSSIFMPQTKAAPAPRKRG